MPTAKNAKRKPKTPEILDIAFLTIIQWTIDRGKIGLRGPEARMLRLLRKVPSFVVPLLLSAVEGYPQTTQGLITGRAIDSISGAAVADARVSWSQVAQPLGGAAIADGAGNFNIPLLSPGRYHLRVEAQGYQGQELYGVDLPVTGRLDFEFRLRPLSDVWETGQFRSVVLPRPTTSLRFTVRTWTPPRTAPFEETSGHLTSLDASVSQVIDTEELRDLPLNGRDVYALLVTQPGVTADTTTGRGLGISVNGQRPTASNFLMDGVENDNYLISGPLVTVAPEAVQEYRLSTATSRRESAARRASWQTRSRARGPRHGTVSVITTSRTTF